MYKFTVGQLHLLRKAVLLLLENPEVDKERAAGVLKNLQKNLEHEQRRRVVSKRRKRYTDRQKEQETHDIPGTE